MPAASDVLTAILVSPAAWVRESYRTRLELDGYTVRVAEDAASAYREVRAHPPDVLFVDRDSGPETAELLAHLLVRSGLAARFPILGIQRRGGRPGPLDAGPLTYTQIDEWWPVSMPVLHVVEGREAG